MLDGPILIDVSRLIWRQWTRRLPTGIDRVCLAYLRHFRSDALAVVQFRRFRRILDRKRSDRLFDLLLNGSDSFRSRLIVALAGGAFANEGNFQGHLYLNVGHTGLNSPHLEPWLASRGLRSVFFIHDIIPITHPQFCREGETARHEARIETALRTASGLIVNSAATELDLRNFADRRGLTMPPTQIAWLGVDASPAPTGLNPTIPVRPYFVMVGTIEARKNHLLILQAWADLVDKLGEGAPDLVVIGQRGWEAQQAIQMLDHQRLLKGHVRELSRCDDMAMGALLANARAMLMPSFVEGFGLPLVEALQLGVPVIASDLPVFRETAGDIPTYLDPYDREAWAKAIVDYAADSPERRRQLLAAAEYRSPDWACHFALVEDFLKTLGA